ncbi:cupin domain-containing protein [Methylobacterium sp. NEAU 140]|uniref:cupin domain-containing protein n=1 Tax=Methylobacterium sp. NEAU 140 TaxID=3064945 RepID=UPI0027362E43|nr:cupin domain-containing protein [Methylobacterium sp. NEAU 140]MDP4023995.1 cupin domain-containing protein [Methylobacterium sp. NEAU 140]
MPTAIRFAGLELRFLQDRHGTNDSLDVFTTTAQPGAGMPIPHYHEGWDETVYGLSGTTTWTVDRRDVDVGVGASIFIPRGVVHGFANRTADAATFLSILTPGVLGPEYFQETADLVNSGHADPGAMRALMLRHGLVPVTAG